MKCANETCLKKAKGGQKYCSAEHAPFSSLIKKPNSFVRKKTAKSNRLKVHMIGGETNHYGTVIKQPKCKTVSLYAVASNITDRWKFVNCTRCLTEKHL